MKFKIKSCLLGAALLILFLTVRNLDVNLSNESSKKLKQLKQKLPLEEDISLIFRYTHETAKYLPDTVNSFMEIFPQMPIVIVSDSNVPQDVIHRFSNITKVQNIPLKIDLLRIMDRNVANYITTKYVFLVPNFVYALAPFEVTKMVNGFQRHKKEFVAVPVQKRRLTCLKVTLNLLQWSIQFQFKKFGTDCDLLRGDHGIFMLTKTLHRIEEPFMLPFPEAFYIQATALNMKVQPLTYLAFQTAYKELKSEDLTQKYLIQKQLMNKKFKIKKIIRENKAVEWYGCTRETPRCFPDIVNSIPDYLYQGRWTPPCCLKVLREVAHHVFKVLKDWSVTFWLEGGSLLGAVRNRDIIPWDYDVDIGVYMQEVNKCPWLRVLNQGTYKESELPSVTDDEGFVWEKARPEEGDFYRVHASKHNRLHVDIFPFYSKKGIMTKKTWFKDHPQDKEFPEHYLKPLTTIDFAGIDAPAPNNVKEFLEFKFGKGCVENPQYPNPKLLQFPSYAKPLVLNDTYNYDVNLIFN